MKHHQEIDESEAEYKALFYHAPIPYIVIDKEFYLVKYNLQADATFGFSQTNSEQQSLLEYLSAESVSALKHWIDTQKYLEESLVVDMLHSRDKIVKFQIQLAQNSYSNNHLMLTLTNIQKEYDQLERSRRQKESISSYARHQERLLSLFDKGDAVLFRWRNDEQWSIDYASKNVEHLIGYRYQEFIDEHTVYVKIIHPDDLKRVKSEVEDAKHKNRDFFEHNPYRIITKSGKERWVLDRTIIQKDKKGNITHYLGYIVDITQEKKLQEEIKKAEIKFHTLFEESLDGIALVDPQTLKFIEFNKALLKIYGYTKEEFRQLSPRDLEVIQNPQEIENRRKKILTKGYNRFTTKHYTKSGDIIEILSHVRVITLNEKKLLYVSFHDITPEIKLQQSIIEAKEEAERANQAKSLFLANMSHEIRTPLHGVIGLTDIVLKSNLDSVQREYLGKVKDSSNALLEIINDILDYSKIEAGKVEITRREFLLNELLQKSADLFGFKSHQKNIAFDFDIDPSIPNQLTGDEFRIAQVLNNLIGNAIKFTTQGSVKLTLRIIEQKRDQIEVEFRVQDSGMGIKQSDQSKLFRSFEQADSSTTKKFGGTGLGLVISKELVELMGGVLWLESQEGVGSTFGFTLLFDYPLAQERFSDQALKQKSILIISKNINDSRYLNRLFTQWGAKVTTISTINDLDRQLKQSFFSHMVIDGEFCDDNSGIDKYINRLKELSCILLIPSYYKEDFSQNVFISNMPFDAIIKKPYTPVWIYNTLTNKRANSKPTIMRTQLKLQIPKKLLLVEDNITNQLVASLLLEEYGFEIDIANNGQEALIMVQERYYDIIFMDIQMPIMDGFEATKMIREFDQSIPIIALSAAVMKEDVQKALSVGMNAHIAKPIKEERLEKILKEYFSFNITTTKQKQLKSSYDIEIEGVDLVSVQKKLNIDTKELYNLYKNFYNDYRAAALISNPQGLNQEELRVFVHKLKGVSGNLEMAAIYELCSKIVQKGATSMDLERLKSKLIHTLQEIKSKIVPYLLEHRSTQEPKTLEETTQLLSEVVSKLENAQYLSRESIVELYESLEERIDKSSQRAILKLFDALEDEKLERLLKKIKKWLHKR